MFKMVPWFRWLGGPECEMSLMCLSHRLDIWQALEVSEENGDGKYLFSLCYQIRIVTEFIKSPLGKGKNTEEIEEI